MLCHSESGSPPSPEMCWGMRLFSSCKCGLACCYIEPFLFMCSFNPGKRCRTPAHICSIHATTMLCPCSTHADPMLRPCHSHTPPMSLPCRSHAPPMLHPCPAYSLPMLQLCSAGALPMLTYAPLCPRGFDWPRCNVNKEHCHVTCVAAL